MMDKRNPLFEAFGQNQNGNDIMSQFNAFRQNFQGDPRSKVQELLNTGQMSQEQFNMLSAMAQNFFNKGGR